MSGDDSDEHRAGHRADAPKGTRRSARGLRRAALDEMVRDLEQPPESGRSLLEHPGLDRPAPSSPGAQVAPGREVGGLEQIKASAEAGGGDAVTPAPGDPRRDRRKYLLPAEHVDRIVDACRAGVPETRIAAALGVNYRTWMRVREEDERVASALAEVRKIEEDELVAVLLDKARKGDTIALLFALKSRHNYRDQGPATVQDNRTNIVINLPDSMTPESYLRMIDVTPAKKGDAK